jgi:hypothetical protein
MEEKRKIEGKRKGKRKGREPREQEGLRVKIMGNNERERRLTWPPAFFFAASRSCRIL